MLLRLDNKQYDDTSNKQEQEQNDLPLCRLLLVAHCHSEFLVRLFNIRGHALDVVVYPIQHRTLVDDHALEVTEDIGQLDDALGNLLNLPLALRYRGIVGVHKFLVRDRLQGRLRKGPVDIGLEERGVGIARSGLGG